MKSNMTMLSIARARAYEKEMQEIRVSDDICVIGFAITSPELSAIYRLNGFTSPEVPRRHVQIWKDLGLVKTYFQDNIIVFVPLITDYDEVYALTMEQKKRGASTIAILPTEASA